MLIFLDTEFTDLLHPALLSLGLVTLDGREHYAELDLSTAAGQAAGELRCGRQSDHRGSSESLVGEGIRGGVKG